MNKLPNPSSIKQFSDMIHFNSNAIAPHGKLNSYMKYTNSYEESISDPTVPEWKYFINEYGFRDKWELSPNKQKIGFFGCSITFGIGLDSRYIFPKIVENRFINSNVESINLGLPGSGIQKIAQLVSASNRLLNFDYVVLTLPTSTRFLLLDERNNFIDIVPGYSNTHFKKTERLLYSNFGQNTLDMYYIDYVHWIKAELRNVKKVIWSTWCMNSHELLKEIIEPDCLIPYFRIFDKARDNHPGVKSHSLHARNIISVLDPILKPQ